MNKSLMRGFTLLEVLIGVALSSVIVAGLSHVYVTAQQTARYQSGLVSITEVGHFSLDMMQHAFERAGAKGRLLSGDVNAELPPVIWSATSDGPRYDAVTLQYRTGPQGGYTCTGGRAEPDTHYISQYRVIPFSGDPRLMQLVCRSATLPQAVWQSSQPLGPLQGVGTGILAAGVEGFQVQYGVRARDEIGTEPQRYVSADAVVPARERVVSVRVALLLKTVDALPVLSHAQARLQPEYFNLLGQQLAESRAMISGHDRQLRRVFEGIFYLRNASGF